LQRRVVCDVEAPIVIESFGLGAFEIAFGQREQIRDFLPSWLMRLEPPVFLPVA
jgi:hypothetical protein